MNDLRRNPPADRSPKRAYAKKEAERTLCFEVHPDANKIQIKQAVEKLFKVKVADVRTANFEGKLRRRGRFAGYRSDWKKAYVQLEAGAERCPSTRRSKER